MTRLIYSFLYKYKALPPKIIILSTYLDTCHILKPLGILVLYQTICILLNSLFSIPTYYFKPMFYYNFLPKIYLEMLHKGGHELIRGSPGSVPVSHLDYVGLTQICGNTCTQVPEPMGQVSVTIQVPISILI